MKIAILVPDFPNSYMTYTYTRAIALSNLGTEVAIFYFHWNSEIDESRVINELRTAQVEFFKVPKITKQTILRTLLARIVKVQYWIFLLKSLRSHLLRTQVSKISVIDVIVGWDPDILHIESSYLAISNCYANLDVFGITTVVSLRGADVDEKPYQSLRWQNWYRNFSKFQSFYIHAPSNYLLDKAVILGIPVCRSIAIYQSVLIHHINAPKTGESERVKFITISRLSKEKGIDLLIEAFSIINLQYDGLNLFIIGDGPERSNLEDLKRQFNLNNIHFLGKKNNIFVREFLLQSRTDAIYVQPSHHEALGQAILEAMSSQIPVIAADVGGIPEIIKHEFNGLLFSASNCTELITNMRTLIEDKELCQQLALEGYKTVQRKFNGLGEAQSFLNWFSQISQAS